MTAVSCRRAADCTTESWPEQLAPFRRLEFAVSDAAKGIAAAVERVAEGRRGDASAPPLSHGLDVFHTAQEANRVLAQLWRWQGRAARGAAQATRAARRRATAAP